MKQYFYQTIKNNNAGKRHYKQILAEETPPYLLKDSISTNLDDFLLLFSIATVNEYGDRTISGKRIC
jgi:hypothetical protein